MEIKKTKIAYLSSSVSWGGLEMNQLRNAVWMHERGHEIIVLCVENSPFAHQALQYNLYCVFIQRQRKYYDFKAAFKLRTIIRTEGIQTLIIRDTRDMSLAASTKFLSPSSSFKLAYFMEMQLGVQKTNLLHTIRFSFIDVWSCPLHFLEKQVHTMTRFNKAKTRVIPSGLELSNFSSDLSKKAARAALNLPEEKIILGLIGRFDPQKGQLLLLEALEKIQDTRVCVCLLGEATKNEGQAYTESIYEKIKSSGLENRVFIRPFRKDIVTFYKAIDCFIMASKAETFGMVTIEAMASGTPTIGSNAGGTSEILQLGKLGYLFTSLDANSLSETILSFISNPEKINSKRLMEAAKQYDHHQICAEVEKHLEL